MRVTVNDEPRELPAEATIAALVETLGLPATRVAVEVNRRLIPRAAHGSTKLADGDRIEVVTLVGGG